MVINELIKNGELKRLREMEERLDLLIEAHSKATPQNGLPQKIQDVLMSTLQFIKEGKE